MKKAASGGLFALLGKERFGGAEEDRTPDLRIANASLSQLSYGPTHRLRCGRDNGYAGSPCQASNRTPYTIPKTG